MLVVVHLKEVRSGTDEEAAKPKGILNIITNYSFVVSLHFMFGFLEVLTKLSKAFQCDKLAIISVYSALKCDDLVLSGL